MPRIPEHVVDDIRQRADIVEILSSYVRLEQRGGDYWCCCPFHEEDTPSFKVSGSRQMFYCFGCKESGNVFSFVMKHENCGFIDAVRSLADRVGVAIPEPEYDSPEAREAARKHREERDLAYDLLDQIAQWYQHKLGSNEGKVARDYLASRAIDEQAVQTFRVGYAPDGWQNTMEWAAKLGFELPLMQKVGLVTESSKSPGRYYDRFRGRLMFPIQDAQGRVVGFSGRILEKDDKSAKYINSPETPYFHKSRILYGFHLARKNFPKHEGALVCEGQLDVIACHRAGLDHAVCAQGTAFTEHHARMLARAAGKVTLAFDADSAGRKAAFRTVELLHDARVTVRAVLLPEGQDPDGLFREGGAERLQSVIDQAMEPIPFAYRIALETHDPQSPQGKSDIVQEIMPLLVSLQEDVAREGNVQWLASELHVPDHAVRSALEEALLQQRQSPPRRVPPSAPPEPDPAPAPRPGLPAFVMQAEPQNALRYLFDLALHYESVAMELCDRLDATLVPDTPLGKAINAVLAQAALGEWDQAQDVICGDQELVTSPDVAQILTQSDCAGLDPETAPEHRRELAVRQLHEAASHCISTLELMVVEQQREQAMERLMATAEDDPAGLEIMQEIQTLNQRKHELQAQRRVTI